MKRTLIFTLTTLMLFFSISHADAGSWLEPSEDHNEGGPNATELGIELNTCTPDGMVNSFKEKWDAKSFWIKQNVALQNELSSKWKYDGAECFQGERDQIEKTECILHYKNLLDSIAKCYRTSTILCRKHGGFC